MKNAKISLLPPFPSSKMSYLQNETKKLCTRASPGATRKWLIWRFMGNIGGGIEWQIREFARLQDANHPKTRLRDLTFEIGQNFSETRSNKVQRRHPFARPKVRPKEPSVQVTRLRRNAWLFLQIWDHLFGWVYWLVSRLIASRLPPEVLYSRFISLWLICYVLRSFCSAVPWFCQQTCCKLYSRAEHGKRTKTQDSRHTKSTTSCLRNSQGF